MHTNTTVVASGYQHHPQQQPQHATQPQQQPQQHQPQKLQPYQQPPQHYQQPPQQPVMYAQQPTIAATILPQHTGLNRNVNGLSVAQIVIGVIFMCMGIASYYWTGGFWLSNIGVGLWSGIWFIVTGILGIVTSKNQTNSCLVGTTMAFNIISAILSAIDGILFLIAVVVFSGCSYSSYYNDTTFRTYRYSSCGIDRSLISSGSIIFGISMALMGVEFFLALFTAIYCCGGCCGTQSRGVIVQQQQAPQSQYIVSNHGTTVSSYPLTNTGGYQPNSTTYSQPEYNTQYDGQQYHQQQQQQTAAATNVVYSQQQEYDSDKNGLMENAAPMAVDTTLPPYSQY